MAVATKNTVKGGKSSIKEDFLKNAHPVYNLCKACMGYKTCTYPIDLSVPALHCAEFKEYPPRQTLKIEDRDYMVQKQMKNDMLSEYTGLCRNCELVQECSNASPGKIVLNCEEYQ